MKRSVVLLFWFISTIIQAQNISVDQKLGEEGKKKVEAAMGFYPDSVKVNVLTQIGNKLVSNLDKQSFEYNFFIVDAGEPNAFALPGGYIFFTRGVLALANSEDELAGVMGHEIIHSHNRHTIKQQKKAFIPGLLQMPGKLASAVGSQDFAKIFSPLDKGGEAIMAKHSRKDEYEADQLGIALAAKSGYQPEALSSMLTNITESIQVFTGKKEKPSYFNDHPYTPDRVERITKGSSKLTVAESTKIFRDNKDFLRFIDGIMVGPNPRHGVFKGDWFLHPDLNCKIRMPATWIRENSASAVAAVDSSESALIMLEIEGETKSAQQAASSFAEAFKNKTGTSINVVLKKVNSLPAAQTSVVRVENNKKFYITLIWVEHEGKVFRLTGGSTKERSEQVSAQMESFDVLDDSERISLSKKIIRVVEARDGETLKVISERSNNIISVSLTAAINGVTEAKIFKQGELVKVIIEVPLDSH